MKVLFKKILFLIPLWLLSGGAFAQTGSSVDSTTVFYVLTGFIMLVALLVLAVCIVVLRLLRFMVKEQAEKIATEKGEEYVEETESVWDKVWASANDVVPIEQEEEILLDHDYDGIKELDNHLPPWWKWTFYLSIVFGVVYLILHHVVDTMPLQLQEYETEVAVAEEQRKELLASLPETVIDENNVEQLEDPGALAKGKQVFNISCAQCHKESGAGGIGPNLTDDYWLHGGTITDVYRT
ncbi:MAG: cbb3-type cytochrome c oxidase N-terminal domain-containing protein, partial [Bacteroidota bacterium]